MKTSGNWKRVDRGVSEVGVVGADMCLLVRSPLGVVDLTERGVVLLVCPLDIYKQTNTT